MDKRKVVGPEVNVVGHRQEKDISRRINPRDRRVSQRRGPTRWNNPKLGGGAVGPSTQSKRSSQRGHVTMPTCSLKTSKEGCMHDTCLIRGLKQYDGARNTTPKIKLKGPQG